MYLLSQRATFLFLFSSGSKPAVAVGGDGENISHRSGCIKKRKGVIILL